MADVTITAANVLLISAPPNGLLYDQVAGVAGIAGQSVYKNAAGVWLLAQGDGTDEEAGSIDLGVLLFSAAAAGARGTIAKRDAIVAYGAIFTAGLFYTIGDTAGGIRPSADNLTGDKPSLIGQAISTSRLRLDPMFNAGLVLA